MKIPESIIIFLKGLLMGSADIIPGVSGGTMALITGIYERLIHAIKDIDFRFVYYFIRRDMKAAKNNFMSVDFALLLPLGAGIGVAFLSLARVIEFMLENQTAPTYAFFFGLIVASAGIVSRYVKHPDMMHILSGVAGFLFVFYIVGLEGLEENHSYPMIFITGTVAICAMILPGISGSLIMLIMGQYEFMLNALNNRQMPELITFLAGAVLGLAGFSRLMDYMIMHHKSITMAFLFGLMLGALRVPVEKIESSVDTGVMSDMVVVVISSIVGFILVTLIEMKSRKIEEKMGIEVEI